MGRKLSKQVKKSLAAKSNIFAKRAETKSRNIFDELRCNVVVVADLATVAVVAVVTVVAVVAVVATANVVVLQ